VHKRYIVKNGVKYGPYFYKSKRVGKKVVNIYVGKPGDRTAGANSDGRSKRHTYTIVSAMILLGILFFIAFRFTGFGVIDFSGGSFQNVRGEVNFSHVSVGADEPYSFEGAYGYGSSGLVAYYSFDGDNIGQSGEMQTGYGVTGGTAYDYSSNDYDGSYEDGAQTVFVGCKEGYGRCVNFDGAGDDININDNFGLGSNNINTKMAWIKLSSDASGNRTVVDFGEDNGQLEVIENGGDYSIYCAASNGDHYESTSENIAKEEWVHVACVSNGSQICGYVNGSLDGCSDINSNEGFGDFKIGGSKDLFQGQIDEVMIFDFDLSAEQIDNIYNAVSPRFVSTEGMHTFTVNLKGYSIIDIVLGDYVILNGTNISVQINSSTNAGEVVTFTDGVVSNYTLPSGSLTSAKLNIIYDTDENKFFSPIAGANITYFVLHLPTINITLNTTGISGEHYSFVDFDKSLIGWWRGENNPNDTLGINNGTLYGNTIYTSGKFGNAFSFDGDGDYVFMNKKPISDTDFWTLSVWAKFSTLSQKPYANLVYEGNDGGGFGIAFLSGKFAALFGGVAWVSSEYTFDTNWHHLVLARNDSEGIKWTNFYVDGNNVFSSSDDYELSAANEFHIGSEDDDFREFNGTIDDVLIFNRTLSAEEIASLYNATAYQYQANITATIGSHTVEGYAIDAAGAKSNSSMLTVDPGDVVFITFPVAYPNINFTLPTPANGTTQKANAIYVNLSSSASYNHYSFVDFDKSLIGWWKGENNPNDTLGTNNGTWIGSVGYSSGKFGNAFNFTGDGAYVQLDHNPDYSSGFVSFSFWFYAQAEDGLGGENQRMYDDYHSSKSRGFSFDYEKLTANISLAVYTNTGLNSLNCGGVEREKMHHLALIFNLTGGYYWCYIDSALTSNGSLAHPGSMAPSKATTIGRGLDGGQSDIYAGIIDELVIFNRTLSASEIKTLYKAVAYQYNNNFTGLANGAHTIKGYAVDAMGDKNQTETRTVRVDTNLPTVNINSTDGSNKTLQNLNCFATISNDQGRKINVSIIWYKNGGINLTADYNNSYTSGTFFNVVLGYGNTTKGENWSCGMRLYDETAYGDWANSTTLTILNTLPVATLVSPADGNVTTNRAPAFSWGGIDVDGDGLTYDFNISLKAKSTCFEPERIVGGLSTTYTLASDLKCFADNNDYYVWSVRANDGVGYGEWSSVRSINISALISISLPVGNVNFGDINYLASSDTTDDSPLPFVIQNDGNVLSNVTVSATDLWSVVGNPNNYFKFKVDNNAGEEWAFNWLKSATSWLQMPITAAVIGLAEFNYSDEADSAEVDLYIEVPPNEPPGNRSSIITFESSLGE